MPAFPMAVRPIEIMRIHQVASLSVFFIASATFSSAPADEPSLAGSILHYLNPADIATYRLHAMPLGNGRVGAMAAGDPKSEVVLLNHHRLRPVLYRETPGKADPALLEELRRLYLAGRDEDAQDVFAKLVKQAGSQRRLNAYHGIGDLTLKIDHAGPIEDYTRVLDMRHGVARVTYRTGGVRYTRTYFVDFDEDLFVVHVEADRPGAISGEIGLGRGAVGGCRLKAAANESSLELEGTYPDATRFDVRAALVRAGGTATVEKGTYEGPGESRRGARLVSTRIAAADSLTVCCTIRVAVEGKSTGGADPQVPRSASDVEARLARHSERHAKAMGRCELRLGDGSEDASVATGELVAHARHGTISSRLVESLFQAGRYQLLASSRPGMLPANLQGVWSDGVRPAWQGRYQLDMNVQMCYWPANVTGLHECNLPLFDLLDSLVPAAKAHARDRYGCRGITLPVGIDENNVRYPSSSEFQGAAGWLARHYWEHYRFTGDEAFLKTRAYPFMKECGEFFEDFLFEDAHGRLTILPSSSPENEPAGRKGRLTLNATIDLSVAKEVFSNLIEGSEILEVDAGRRDRWREILDKLPDWPIDGDGALAEWADPSAKERQTHRHLSHLYGLFPGEAFTLEDSPERVAAAVNAIRKREGAFREDACGWTYAWLMSLYARAGEGDEAYRNLGIYCRGFLTPDNLISSISDLSGTGLGRTRHGHLIQIEAGLGVTAGIAEMLLQSHEGFIRTLPALPKAWPEGNVRGLWARGGFEVDIDWAEGAERGLTIRSHRGGTCRLCPRNEASEWEVRRGDDVVSLKRGEDGMIVFETAVDGVYHLLLNHVR